MRAFPSSVRSRSPATGSPGGIGTHETALASPDVVDLGGRCVLPGFTDSHVHFPTWALARRRDPARRRALARGGARAGRAPAGARARGSAGTAGATATGSRRRHRRRRRSTRVTGDAPAALLAHDYHSLWLNSAGARARERRPRGRRAASSSATRRASRRASFARRPRGGSRSATSPMPDDEYVEAMRDGAAGRGRARRHVRPRQGRLARRAPALAAARASNGALTLRVWQSIPHEQLDRAGRGSASARARRRATSASAT